MRISGKTSCNAAWDMILILLRAGVSTFSKYRLLAKRDAIVLLAARFTSTVLYNKAKGKPKKRPHGLPQAKCLARSCCYELTSLSGKGMSQEWMSSERVELVHSHRVARRCRVSEASKYPYLLPYPIIYECWI